MTALFVVLAVASIVAIALLAVRAAERSMAGGPAARLFEVDEAVEFVASALPAEVATRLSYEDVEALLGWHLVHLAGRAGEVDIVDEAVVADLVRRAEADDREISARQVRAVLDAEVAYLEAIGAIDEGAE